MQLNEIEDNVKFINDNAHRGIANDKKKTGRFSVKNTLKFESTVKSAKSFKSLKYGKSTNNLFKKVKFRIDFWKYIPKINPLGQFRIIWDIFVGSSTLFLFFSISISLSFSQLILLNNLPVYISIFIFGILIDLNTGYYEQGIFIRNRKMAALNYLRKYFAFDLISTICLVEQAFNDKLHYIIILFFLKGQYFTKISKIFKEVLHVKPIFHSIVSFCKLICVIIFAAHFFACIYISVVTYFDFSDNWIGKQQLSIDQTFRVYVRAFYYSCVTMLTVGYGDVTPQNDLEYCVVILTVLSGCIFFGYSLNKIGTIFNEMEEQDKKILKNLFIINQYMSRKDIQKDLQFQVREYLTYYWSQNNSTENKAQEQIISQLSEGLKQKLQIQATRKVLNQCPIFRQNFTDEFLQKASTLIKEYRCYPDEIITFQGDVDDCSIFFVEQGTAVMYFQGNTNYLGKNDTSVDVKELQKGDTFGFHSFFTGQPRKLTIRSAGFTSLLLIERIPFMKLIRQYPQDYEIYCTISENLQTGQLYQQVHSDCYCCKYNDHMITDCPKIHLVVDKVILQKYKSLFNKNTIFNNKQLILKYFWKNQKQIELSQRDLKQVRNSHHLRKNKKQKVIKDENLINPFIQEQLFYLQAYYQLFIGAFGDYDDDDEDDDIDEEYHDNYSSNDRVSIAQDMIKYKKNESSLMPFEEDSKLKKSQLPQQRTQEKKITLIPPDQQGIKEPAESLLNIDTSVNRTKELDLSSPQQRQLNFNLLNEKKQTRTVSLTKIKNSSFSITDDFMQQQGIQDNSVSKYSNQYQDQLPSLQINAKNKDFDHIIKKQNKKSLGESFSDLDKVQSQLQILQQGYDKVQSQQLIQPQQNQKPISQTLIPSPQAQGQLYQNQLQQQQQQGIQQYIQAQQMILQQQNILQQQILNQYLNQLQSTQQIYINNSSTQSPQIAQNIPNSWQQQQQIQSPLRRRSSVMVVGQFQQNQNQNQILNLQKVFPTEIGKSLLQLQDLSQYQRTQNSFSNLNTQDLFKQLSQSSYHKGSRSQQQTHKQTSLLQSGDKLMLLQKLNNTNPMANESNEEDCKMKIFNFYFPEWNVNCVLQKINLDNGFSINSSEIIISSDHKELTKISSKSKQSKIKQADQTISNKRVTSVIYQNANEKKVQEVLSSLNQGGGRHIDEQNINDNQLALPSIPHYIRDQRKGNTVLIPTIKEQNQQLAALKFTHQSINDKFIVFRKNNPQQPDQEKPSSNYLTSEFMTSHKDKLKSMKRKSVSVDVDLIKKLKPTSNFIIPSSSEKTIKGFMNQKSLQNISAYQNKNKIVNLDLTGNTLDISENVILDVNDEYQSPIIINSHDKQNNNLSWSQYVNQKY